MRAARPHREVGRFRLCERPRLEGDSVRDDTVFGGLIRPRLEMARGSLGPFGRLEGEDRAARVGDAWVASADPPAFEAVARDRRPEIPVVKFYNWRGRTLTAHDFIDLLEKVSFRL